MGYLPKEMLHRIPFGVIRCRISVFPEQLRRDFSPEDGEISASWTDLLSFDPAAQSLAKSIGVIHTLRELIEGLNS